MKEGILKNEATFSSMYGTPCPTKFPKNIALAWPAQIKQNLPFIYGMKKVHLKLHQPDYADGQELSAI